jgi:hypothetical protein
METRTNKGAKIISFISFSSVRLDNIKFIHRYELHHLMLSIYQFAKAAVSWSEKNRDGRSLDQNENAGHKARKMSKSSLGLADYIAASPNVYVDEEGCEGDWNASWR